MRLRSITADVVELRGRGGAGTPLIVGCGLLALSLLTPIIATGPVTQERLAAEVVLFAISCLFIWFGRPKARVVRIRPRERTVQAPGRGTTTIAAETVFRLVDAPAVPVAGPLRYGVALESRGTEPLLVLDADEPAKVLNDLVRLRAYLPLPVLAGWGLSHAVVPWLEGATAPATPARAAQDDPVEPQRRRAGTSLGVCTAGAAGLLAMEIHGRASRGDIASPISLVLPALSICLLVAITFVVLRLKPRVSAEPDLSFEWRIGALRFFPRFVDAKSVRSAEVVSPTGAGGRHLLMCTASGEFVAFPCERGEGASAVARLTEGRPTAAVR